MKKWIVFMLIGVLFIMFGVFSMPVIWIQSDFLLFKLGWYLFAVFTVLGTAIGGYSFYLFCKENGIS